MLKISQLGDMFIVNHVVDHHNINVLSRCEYSAEVSMSVLV